MFVAAQCQHAFDTEGHDGCSRMLLEVLEATDDLLCSHDDGVPVLHPATILLTAPSLVLSSHSLTDLSTDADSPTVKPASNCVVS